MTTTNEFPMFLLKCFALFAFLSTGADAQRGLPPITDATSYLDAQQAHISALRERMEEGNQRFIAEREIKRVALRNAVSSSGKTTAQSSSAVSANNTEPKSDVLVSFPVRLTVSKINQYVKGLGGSALRLHRSVGDDQLSFGASTAFDTPTVEIESRRDFLAYLDVRGANMQSEITRTDPGSYGRLSAVANLAAVVRAREMTHASGMTFDGVLVRLPDGKLAEVYQLPEGMTALLAEIQTDTRAPFAIPLDVLKKSQNEAQ